MQLKLNNLKNEYFMYFLFVDVEVLKTKKVLVQHVETVSSYELTDDIVQSYVVCIQVDLSVSVILCYLLFSLSLQTLLLVEVDLIFHTS